MRLVATMTILFFICPRNFDPPVVSTFKEGLSKQLVWMFSSPVQQASLLLSYKRIWGVLEKIAIKND